ncbi:DUF6069 family protein [Agromyces larvae]|uniref:DUF6069 family protein n=1 Tax=Agromyces larvae TaxID=2929802 RepID=A0ABY4BY26_9MICO|nr:DUF6069 family protein [Agromyces larvae]UOE44136.1 DUF6069 family protein [Agromyces larvae]
MDETTISQALRTETDASSPRRRRLGRLATIGIAAALALVVWAIAVPVAGIALTVGAGATAQTVGPAAVVFAVLVPGFAAWVVLALLERFARHPHRVFAIVGWAVLAVSLAGPVLTGAGGAVLVALLAMHVVTGATLVIGLPFAARRARGASAGRE